MIWDHNKERVFERAEEAFRNKKAADGIWGIAFHFYSGDHFEALEMTHDRWPDKALVFTEGGVGLSPGCDLWQAAEAYAHDIIGDLNHHTAAWCDWNLLLDSGGGPNHVGNYCLAAAMATEDFSDIVFEPVFWYIGQFSRFIKPGSVRIGCSRFSEKLECAAFLRPDGKRALVVLNRTGEAIPFVLRWNGSVADALSGGHSLMTLVF
jgi:glucosylceramidase